MGGNVPLGYDASERSLPSTLPRPRPCVGIFALYS